MALTKIPRGLLDTGIADSSDATAITIDSSENITFAGAATFNSTATIDPADGVADDIYALTVRNNEATDGRNYGLWVRAGSTSGDESFSVRNHDNSTMYLKVRGDGNIGIGTSTPTAKLHIEVADNTEFLKATITGNEAWAFKGASGSGSTDYVSFGISGGTQAMAWQEDGKVGIGTTAPVASLHVFNNESGGTSTLRLRNQHTDKITRIQLEDSTGGVGDALIAYVHSDASSANHYLGLGVNNQTALSITNNDYVGINNTGPLYPLDATGAGEIQARFKSTGDTGYTQGAIVIESSESTSSPQDRGQGVYMFNHGTDKTWYMGTTYADAGTFQIGVVGGSTLQKTAASNSSGEGALRINSSRIVTLPKHPLFIATGTGGWTVINGVNIIDTSVFSENYDQGGNFTPSNGRFTAPVTGYYLFVFHSYTRANDTSGYVYPNFYVNGTLWTKGANTMIQHYVGHGDEDHGTCNTAHIYLTATQYVQVGHSQYGNSNSISYHGGSLGFSGHLIG